MTVYSGPERCLCWAGRSRRLNGSWFCVSNCDIFDLESSSRCTHNAEPVLKGIAICGEDIQVASVVLRQNTRHRRDLDASMKKLKDTGIRVNKHTVAFMFACVARGRHMHKKSNVEATVFRNHFPRVPLFGFFGNGEIGYDYLPDYTPPGNDEGYSVLSGGDLPEMYRSYSTVFVILSLPTPS